MFYRRLLTYFFRRRYLPSVLAASLLSALLCFVLQVAFVDSANFQCNFPLCAPQFSLCLSLPLSPSVSLSFDFRLFPCHFHLDMCVCVLHICRSVCALHFLAICCAKPFSKSMRKLSSQRGAGADKREEQSSL